MKTTVMNLARGCAVAAMLLGGAAVSEASSITLIDGASSVELCLPGGGCGSPGLSSWIADGSAVTGFQQWFSGLIYESYWPSNPVSWSGALESLDGSPTVTHTAGSSTAKAEFAGDGVGLTVNYELAAISGVSHILETIKLNNWDNGHLFASLTDGLSVNVEDYYILPYQLNVTLATADYTPNPEPMSLLLMGTGLAAVARNRWRKGATV